MRALGNRLAGFGSWPIGIVIAVWLAIMPESPARAFDLFAHEVTAQFATANGKPMANAEVRVFAPGQPETPVETGHTDADGKFIFPADRDGMWTAEARTQGEVARVMIRVGGATQQQPSGISPVVVIAGLLALLALAVWYRMLRRRNQRRPR